MIIKTIVVAWWKTKNAVAGSVFPGIVISRARVGNLKVVLRADGYVVIRDEAGATDMLPITCVSIDVGLKLINAQQWPWQDPATHEEAAHQGVDV